MIQDLHVHTVFSDGIDVIDNILNSAEKNGIEIGISDHIYCKKLLTTKSILEYFSVLESYPVLKGAELDIGTDRILDDCVVSKADYIIGSVHSVNLNGSTLSFGKYFDSRAQQKILNSDFIFDDFICCKALEEIIKSIKKDILLNPINIIGHCTVNPFYEQVNAKFRYEWENELLSICKSYHIAIEISGLWIEPSIDLIKRAINQNIKVTFGSDCHTFYSTSYTDYFKYAECILNLKQGDIAKVGKR